MICPKCKKNTKVIDSRDVDNCVRRRRECLGCHFRFTTYEKIEPVNLVIIKKNGSREQYDRNKIFTGILTACKNRSIDKEEIEDMVEEIECSLLQKAKELISSKTIGSLVLERLKKTDKVAYLRFASVHKKFANPERFVKEWKKIR